MIQSLSQSKSKEIALEQFCDHAQQLIVAGNIARALRIYQVACLQYPTSSRPWIGLGLCQKQLGNNVAAELALTLAQNLGAQAPGILTHRAECRLRLGQTDKAVSDLEEASKKAQVIRDDRTLKRSRRVLDWLRKSRSQEMSP